MPNKAAGPGDCNANEVFNVMASLRETFYDGLGLYSGLSLETGVQG
jgi:hypothetical protein